MMLINTVIYKVQSRIDAVCFFEESKMSHHHCDVTHVVFLLLSFLHRGLHVLKEKQVDRHIHENGLLHNN